MYTLIVTAKLNDVDPQARLADVLACIAALPNRAGCTTCWRGTGKPPGTSPWPRRSAPTSAVFSNLSDSRARALRPAVLTGGLRSFPIIGWLSPSSIAREANL